MVLGADAVVDEKEPNMVFAKLSRCRPGTYARANIQSEKDVDVFVFFCPCNQSYKASVTSGGPLLADLEIKCLTSVGNGSPLPMMGSHAILA